MERLAEKGLLNDIISISMASRRLTIGQIMNEIKKETYKVTFEVMI